MATGLGVSLGVANNPTHTATSSSVRLVPTWKPPNVAVGVVAVGQHCSRLLVLAVSDGLAPKFPSSFIGYGQGRCQIPMPQSLAPSPLMRAVVSLDISGRHVTILEQGGTAWATWQQGSEHFVVWSQQVSLPHVVRFIGGLKAA